MADTRTMLKLLQAPTEGYRDAIVLPPIFAKNFELKVGLLTLVTSSQFHGFERDDPHSHIQLHQINTFYNALTQSDQDSLNATVGGNLLNRTPRDALTIIENKSKVRTLRNKPVVSKASATTSSSTLAYLPKIIAFTNAVKAMLLQNKTPSLAPVKAIEDIYVPWEVIPLLTRSGISYDGPTIPPTSSLLLKEVEREPEKLSLSELTPTRMTLELTNRSVSYPVGVTEDVFVKVRKFHLLADFVVVDYDVDPRVPLILERPFLKMARALIDVYGKELTL
nr:reverse transcriptase domain-containing protein [Tanacetum cinerariifolium]